MHAEITELIPTVQAAVRAADAAAEQVFAQIGERAYGRTDAMVIVERVLDVDSDSRDILLAERAAYTDLLITPAELYREDRTDEVFALAGLDIAAGRAAFRVTNTVAAATENADLAVRGDTYLGLPLRVMEGREFDVRLAAAWLRARPASAHHWTILEALLP